MHGSQGAEARCCAGHRTYEVALAQCRCNMHAMNLSSSLGTDIALTVTGPSPPPPGPGLHIRVDPRRRVGDQPEPDSALSAGRSSEHYGMPPVPAPWRPAAEPEPGFPLAARRPGRARRGRARASPASGASSYR